MNYFIGIDIGSQSSKGVIINEIGEIICDHFIAHTVDSPKPGYFEQDADGIWYDEFCNICKTLILKSKVDKNYIKAVGHSATSPCLIFLDKNNKPLRKGILYGIDTRASKEIEELTDIIGFDNIINTGGCILSSQSVAPKILWVKKNEPDIYKKTRKILSASGYITYKLTDLYTLNTYDAVGYTGLFDIFKKDWIDEYFQYIAPFEYFPHLVSPSSFVGSINKEASLATGLNRGTPVLAGIADAAAESVGCGVSDIGEMMLMLGTSSFFILLTKKLYKTSKFWPSNFLFENEYVLTGGTSNCGSSIIWFIDTFCKGSSFSNIYDILLNEARENEISEYSPIIVPYFAGERTPIHDYKAKAIFFGLSFNHTRGDLYKSLLEGISYSIKYNIDELRKLASIDRIYAIGGGIKNSLLLRLISDICQVSICIPSVDIGASFGDALLAMKCYKPNICIRDFIDMKSEIIPSSNNAELFLERYNVFQKLYKDTHALLK